MSKPIEKEQVIERYYHHGVVMVRTNGNEKCETILELVEDDPVAGGPAVTSICVSTASLLRAIAVSQGVSPVLFSVGFLDDGKDKGRGT